jgi:polysaccharide biosynthesis transport protein
MRKESRPAAPGPVDSETDDLDLGAMWRALKRRRSWIIGTTLAAFLAASAFVFLVKPRYTAGSQVLIENQENFFTRPDGAAANPTEPPDDAAVASQIELLTSSDLARQAIAALGLAKNPEFNPHASAGVFSRVAALIGLVRPPSSATQEDQILQNYYDRLAVYQVEKSRVVEIDFTSQDPALAARAANEIADLYIGVQIAAKRQEAKEAATSLGQEVQLLQTRLATAEDKAESFRAANGLLMGPNNTTLSDQQLADLNTQLSTARAAEADSAAQAKLIRETLANGQLDEISDIANNELVRQISMQRVTLRAQLALESRTLLPQHPQIKELQAQLADLDEQLRDAAVTVARGLENDARLAQARYESIQTTLDQQKQTVGDSGVSEVRMRALDQDAKLISDQLEDTTAKYQEAVARETATSTPGDARVISRAIAPELPTYPRKGPTLLFASLAGLVLSSAAALAAELLSTGAAPSYAAPEEVVDAPRPSVRDRFAGVAASERGRAEPFLAKDPDPALVEESSEESEPAVAPLEARDGLSGLISQAIAISRASGRADCMLVVGATETAPAGALAVDIGRRLATDGRSILVELRPGLLAQARFAAAEGRADGFGELVAGDRSFAEVIDRDDESRLHFIVAGEAAALSGESLDVALEALSETYDHLILLAAPLGPDSLAKDIAGAADLVALVDGGRGSEAKLLETRTELIRAGAGKVVAVNGAGVVETDPIEQHVSAA